MLNCDHVNKNQVEKNLLDDSYKLPFLLTFEFSLNVQWFIRFSEFAEFSVFHESYAPFRENPTEIILVNGGLFLS